MLTKLRYLLRSALLSSGLGLYVGFISGALAGTFAYPIIGTLIGAGIAAVAGMLLGTCLGLAFSVSELSGKFRSNDRVLAAVVVACVWIGPASYLVLDVVDDFVTIIYRRMATVSLAMAAVLGPSFRALVQPGVPLMKISVSVPYRYILPIALIGTVLFWVDL